MSPPSSKDLHRIALAALCLSAASVARAEITLDVQINRTQIYLGESLLINVTVNGADDGLPAPDLSALKADVQPLGSQSQSQHVIQIINGHITRNDTQSRLFQFNVKPRASGTFATGPITLMINHHQIQSSGPDVQVTGQESQDFVIAKVLADRESVLVDSPFNITLSVAVAGIPAPNEKFEPIDPSSPPRLACDILSQAEISGLQTPNLQQLMQGLVTDDPRTPAFQINDYQAQAPNFFSNPFAGLDPFHPRPIRFRLEPSPITLNQRAYREYKLTLTYTPRQEGDYTFGPLSFKGPVITGATAQGQPILRQISCVGPAVTVRVVPPPETNRPDCFIGSVGTNLSAHAALDAAICKVGDPLTLTLDIAGAISLGNIRPPMLNLQPNLTADFRIYDDNVESTAIPSGKRFRYRIRPIREGTLEFPPVQVAWYDTAGRAYRTVHTQPIPVQAHANTQLISDSTNAVTHVTRLTVERTTTTPSAITVVDAGARTEHLLPATHTMLSSLVAGPLGWLIAWAGLLFHRNRASLSAAHRRNRALPQALAALRAASHAPHPDAATVGHVLRAYLTARLGIAGGSLTSGETIALLQTHGVPEATAAACGALLVRLDQSLYRPDTRETETAGVIREAMALLPQIASSLDRPLKETGDGQ